MIGRELHKFLLKCFCMLQPRYPNCCTNYLPHKLPKKPPFFVSALLSFSLVSTTALGPPSPGYSIKFHATSKNTGFTGTGETFGGHCTIPFSKSKSLPSGYLSSLSNTTPLLPPFVAVLAAILSISTSAWNRETSPLRRVRISEAVSESISSPLWEGIEAEETWGVET